jgi:phage tail-like protein
MQSGSDNFRYLNREGKWLDFHWKGLELSPQGALRLLSSPHLDGAQPNLSAVQPSAPNGIAIDDSGRQFYTTPDEDRIVVSGGCDSQKTTLNCLTEALGWNGLKSPRGLLILHNPDRLVIVDSGNNRLLFYDLIDFDLREVWGSSEVNGLPAGEAVDQFLDPWTVATDAAGSLYVLDAGNHRILKFARTGEAKPEFLQNMQSSGLISDPTALTVSVSSKKTLVFVFDGSAKSIFVFDDSGQPLLDDQGLPVTLNHEGMDYVIALAASDSYLYVGDNSNQRFLSFSLTDGFPFSGDAAGFKGFVSALALDVEKQKLLVSMGGDDLLVLDQHGAYLSFGFLWSDAIQAGPSPVNWDRLCATVARTNGAHVEFYFAVSDSPATPPVDVTSEEPFSNSQWQKLAQDVEDFLLPDEKKVYLFIAAAFISDRTSTPQLTQMRVEFDTDSFMKYLPAIYREPSLAKVERPGEPPVPDVNSDFLKRFVSWFQSLFEDIENEIDTLDSFFDPYAAPPEALYWLASWLAVEIDLDEPEMRLRQSIARAFRRYQWRGTVAGLRLALLEDAGVHATISEPISAATFFSAPPPPSCGVVSVGAGTQLGMNTHLTAMEPGGAVLGSTAQLDHSYLITDAQFGEPIFAGSASQFVVEVNRAEVNTEARMRLVHAILDREKPAHTMYRLIVNDPTMRVGSQSRIGVDSMVSGLSGPTPLGKSGAGGLRLGRSSALRIGASRLGEDLKL